MVRSRSPSEASLSPACPGMTRATALRQDGTSDNVAEHIAARKADVWRYVTDLREELSQYAPSLARLGRPLSARALQLSPGTADLNLAELADESFGLLVLDGLLLVELNAGRAQIGWLVGEHDLIRPSGMLELALTERSRWRALNRTRIAVLDRAFVLSAAAIPGLSRVLVTCATRTASWLFAKALIASSPLIEERLLLIFALFGERWGKATAEGVMIRLPLSHANLAVLCGARRPSVTLALQALQRDGVLTCRAKGTWLIRRDRPRNGAQASALAVLDRSLGLASSRSEPER
jgi:CRP/FNR family transcriptional regulator, cyclic AMP receptor protein